MIKEIANMPDISFIDNLTLDDVQSQMVAAYEDKYTELTGKSLSLRRADPETLKLYAASVQIYQLMLHVDKAGKMDLLKYAYGSYLDHLGALRSVTRLPAYPAQTKVRFTLSDVQPSVVTIPVGTRVSNGGEFYFETTELADIPIGELTVDVSCICQTAGADANHLIAGVISTLVDPIPYVDSVRNIEESDGGADVESDEDFAERIYLAPGSYSVAGPKDAYIYHTRSYSSAIGDVEVTGPPDIAPGEVEVRFLQNDSSLPTDEMIEGVDEYLSKDDIRPLTDHVTVMAPTEVTFDLDFSYFIARSDRDKAVTIQTAVAQAVQDYIFWQTSVIGRDLNPSVLTQMVVDAGAKRTEVRSPKFTVTPRGHVARIGSQACVYGGIEDD